jgi:hypothetical protein
MQVGYFIALKFSLWLNQLTETRQGVSILVTWARMPTIIRSYLFRS